MSKTPEITIPFPKYWGDPPRMRVTNVVKFPHGFGAGSGTIAGWIESKIQAAGNEQNQLIYKIIQCDKKKLTQQILLFHEGDEKVLKGYQAAIDELFSFDPPKDPHHIFVYWKKLENEEGDIDCGLLNKYFVCDPEPNLSPWGGNSEDKFDCPEGYYNANWNGYQKYYAMSGLDRARYAFARVEISSEVIGEGVSLEEAVAMILWELTFEGMLEKDSKEFWNEIARRFNEVKKDFKNE